MQRRHALQSIAGIGVPLVAGCLSDDQDVTDSDGDGVIDSEDYAPNDPDVQERGDLEAGSSTLNQTTSDPDASDDNDDGTSGGDDGPPSGANELRANADDFPTDSFVASYSSEGVTAVINPDDPALSDLTLSNYDVQVFAASYPRNSIVADAVNRGVLDAAETTTLSVPLGISDHGPEGPLHYMLFLVPSGQTFETAASADIVHLHETDPFVLGTDGSTIERTAVPELAGITDDSGANHDRVAKEGVIELSFDGRTEGRRWNVTFYTFKSAYVESVRRDHGRSRPEFVSYEMTSGFSREVARLLEAEAEANGFTDKRMQVEFVIDFVQHLPYVPDDVSTGHDDYTKFSMETITECGGDCEDTAILLTSILQADPFGYDTVLIQPPGHMAAGIKGADDLPGYYWEDDGTKYYYIETTGVGWGIGDLPEEYQDAKAHVHQV